MVPAPNVKSDTFVHEDIATVEDNAKIMTEEEKNIAMIQGALAAWGAEGEDGYIRNCHEDFTGSILAGIIPGGENLNGLDDLRKMFGSMGDYMEFRKFEPRDWAAVGNTVYFTVDWELKLKDSEKWVECSANVRKVVKDGKICEKYHLVDSTRIKQLSWC